MVIEPAPAADKQHWIIVSNPRPATPGGVRTNIDAPEPVTLEWDWCWTGDRWSSKDLRARQFASREEAQRCIDENTSLLVASYEE